MGERAGLRTLVIRSPKESPLAGAVREPRQRSGPGERDLPNEPLLSVRAVPVPGGQCPAAVSARSYLSGSGSGCGCVGAEPL